MVTEERAQYPVVFLDHEGVGLLFPAATRVVYEVQCGGYACIQERLEGFYVPLDREVVDHYPELHGYFAETLYGGCAQGVDERAADFIDATLRRWPGHSGIQVDRSRLHRSRESWIHVTVSNPTLSLLVQGLPNGSPAVLCWPNSD